MIWIALALLAGAALTPLAFVLRHGDAARSRRDSDLALHRAQLAELDTDLADGRIGAAEHKEARLEIQRRLLATDAIKDSRRSSSGRAPIIAVLTLVPLGALALYLAGGSPFMPAAPLATRIAEARAEQQEASQLITDLRARLATIDPHSPQAREGYTLLGNAEAAQGDYAAAAAAWRTALESGFDPTLAAEAAEAATRAEGHVSQASAVLFRKALAAAPPDAPWRPMAEQRLTQSPPG